MKKALLLLAASVVLSLSAICVSAEDFIPTKDKYDVVYDVGDTNASGMYGMVAIIGTNTIIDTSNLNNIMYIDQTTADANGIIEFKGFAPKGVAPSHKDFKECTVFIGGPGFDTATAIGVLREGQLGFFIEGKVVGVVGSKTATVTVKDAAGDTLATTTAEEDGTFSIPVPAGEGYSVVVTVPNYLSYTITGVDVLEDAEDAIALPNADLSTSAGDINADGYVTTEDLGTLLSDFGELTIKNPNSDIDKNGYVTVEDLGALLSALGENPKVVPMPQ